MASFNVLHFYSYGCDYIKWVPKGKLIGIYSNQKNLISTQTKAKESNSDFGKLYHKKSI